MGALFSQCVASLTRFTCSDILVRPSADDALTPQISRIHHRLTIILQTAQLTSKAQYRRKVLHCNIRERSAGPSGRAGNEGVRHAAWVEYGR